jgi:hypothetical protein
MRPRMELRNGAVNSSYSNGITSIRCATHVKAVVPLEPDTVVVRILVRNTSAPHVGSLRGLGCSGMPGRGRQFSEMASVAVLIETRVAPGALVGSQCGGRHGHDPGRTVERLCRNQLVSSTQRCRRRPETGSRVSHQQSRQRQDGVRRGLLYAVGRGVRRVFASTGSPTTSSGQCRRTNKPVSGRRSDRRASPPPYCISRCGCMVCLCNGLSRAGVSAINVRSRWRGGAG